MKRKEEGGQNNEQTKRAEKRERIDETWDTKIKKRIRCNTNRDKTD